MVVSWLCQKVKFRLRGPLAFDPGDEVVAAYVRFPRIDGINIVFITGNNVGTSSSFKDILHQANTGLPSSPHRRRNKVSRSEPNKAGYYSSA